MNMADKQRISLDMGPEAVKRLRAVQAKAGFTTVAELFRKSLALLDLATDHIKDGGSIVLKNADGSQETLKLL